MQDKCAMKVCTDSCIFGAWIEEPEAKRVLDIGAGTGLLSLMIAQRHEAKIDAVEIDAQSYLQMKENISWGPWENKINAFNYNIQSYNPHCLYDVIVSNPPFFSNHLKSPDSARNGALHAETLTLEDLMASVDRLLDSSGRFYVLLPPEESRKMDGLALTKGLLPFKKMNIKERTEKSIFRTLTGYSKIETKPEEKELIIRNPDLTYSSDFENLLREFYLHL